MSNSLGTLSSTLILTRSLALVFTKRPVLRRFSLNLAPDAALFNQTVMTRLRSVPPVTNFGAAPSDVTTADVPVTIDQFKQVQVQFTPQQISATERDLVDEQAEPIAVAIGNFLVDDVASLFTDANYGTTNKSIVTVANTGYSSLVGIRKKLVLRGVPEQQERFALVNADLYEKFLNDPLCNRAGKVILNGNDPISSGELTASGGIAGFPAISEYPNLPTTNNLLGVYGTPDAVALASRVPKDPRSVLPGAPAVFNSAVITDPGSGFSVFAQEWIGTDLTANVRLSWMYGKAIGNPNNVERQVSA